MKDKILVRRKHTPRITRQQRKEVEVPTCVTSYSAGMDIEYKFDINQTDFEVDPRHLPLILTHCDMEVVSTIEASNEASNKNAVVEEVDAGDEDKE